MTTRAEQLQRAFDDQRAKRGLPPMSIEAWKESRRAASEQVPKEDLLAALAERISEWLKEIEALDERPEINQLMHEMLAIVDTYEDSLDRITGRPIVRPEPDELQAARLSLRAPHPTEGNL